MGWLAHNGDRSTVNMGPYVAVPYTPMEELFKLLVARGSVGVSWGDQQVPIPHTGTGLGPAGSFALPNSWQIIEDPDGVQHCFQNLGVGGLYAQTTYTRSLAGLFTGAGGPGGRPTAADEEVCYSSNQIFSGVYGNQYFHAVAADEAIGGRWPFWFVEVGQADGDSYGTIIYGGLERVCAADQDPAYTLHARGGFSVARLCDSGGYLRGYNRGVWDTVYADAQYFYGSVKLPGAQLQDWDGYWRTMHPTIRQAQAGGYEVKGLATGLVWAPRNAAGYPTNHNILFRDQNGVLWYYLDTATAYNGPMLPGWPDETVCPLPDMGAGVSVVDIIIDNAPAPTPDTTAPTISVVSPTPGGPIAAAQPIVVDVTDAGGLGLVVLTVEQGTAHEVVWLRDTFAATYAGSTRAAIAGGHRYTVRRAGGWTASPVFHVEAIDLAGNLGA